MIPRVFSKCNKNYYLSIILLLSALLRIFLACFNREANDDHLLVSSLLVNMFKSGLFPPYLQNCWQCYHPKLYHYLCAELFYLFNIEEAARLILAQFVSATAGVATLFTIKVFIQRQIGLSGHLRLLLFALVAFNPSLIKIDVQATNDSLVIFFGVAGTYFLYRFLQSRDLKFVFAASLFISFGILTKGNGLVVLAWAFVALLIWLLQCIRSRAACRSCILGILVLSALALITFGAFESPFSPYKRTVPKLLKTQSLNARGFHKPAPLHFFERAINPKAGAISIYDSYLTFPILGLIKEPYISNGRVAQPFHRTSLWAQIYGRLHFPYFDQYVWRRLDSVVILTGQLLMAAALLPTLLLLWGGLRGVFVCSRQLIFSPRSFLQQSDWSLPVLFACFIAMIIQYSMDSRAFCAMKDIYIFPGLLAYVSALISSVRIVSRKAPGVPYAFLCMNLILLLLLYCASSALVVQQFLRS